MVLRLSLFVSDDASTLTDDVEYATVKEDVTKQCASYGTVESVEIPRPDSSTGEGVGFVVIQYSAEEEAQTAREELTKATTK